MVAPHALRFSALEPAARRLELYASQTMVITRNSKEEGQVQGTIEQTPFTGNGF